MPREYQRKTKTKYDHATLMTAIEQVKAGESIYGVSKNKGIPYGTLYRRCHDKIQRDDKRIGSGRGFVLTNTEEKLMVEALMYLADRGFPQDREDVKLMVKSYIISTGRNTPFKDDKPGKDWCIAFEKRWKENLGKRKPELLTRARATDLSEETLTKFFELYEKTLDENNLSDRPHCIFNLDETGLRTDPTAGKIFVRKSSKTAYYLTPSCGKAMYTVLFCGSAAGQCLPPFVVYKALNLYDSWCKNGPNNAMYGVTTSGWMEDYLFESWMDKFITFVKDLEKPVLLLCDGHNSHLTYSTVKKAQDNQIILFCLPPNTSHALQPLDVGFFAPLKSVWKKVLKEWLRESRHKNVDKSIFPSLLKKLVDQIDGELLKSGFNGSGLFPIDRSKPMKKVVTVKPKGDTENNSNPHNQVVEHLQRAIESVLTPSPSQSTVAALANTKKRRARVQAKKGEILTEHDVAMRLNEEEKKRSEKKNPQKCSQKRKLKDVSNLTETNCAMENSHEMQLTSGPSKKTIYIDESISIDDLSEVTEPASEDESNPSNLDDNEKIEAQQPECDNLKAADWIVVCLKSCRRDLKFVAQILQVIEDDNVWKEFEVTYLKQKSNHIFSWPDPEDTSIISKEQIIGTLKEPTLQRRGELYFIESI